MKQKRKSVKSRRKKHDGSLKRKRSNSPRRSPTFRHKIFANTAADKALKKSFKMSVGKLSSSKYSRSSSPVSPRNKSKIYYRPDTNSEKRKIHIDIAINNDKLQKSRKKILSRRLLDSKSMYSKTISDVNKYFTAIFYIMRHFILRLF
jgi:hypothetical protein